MEEPDVIDGEVSRRLLIGFIVSILLEDNKRPTNRPFSCLAFPDSFPDGDVVLRGQVGLTAADTVYVYTTLNTEKILLSISRLCTETVYREQLSTLRLQQSL